MSESLLSTGLAPVRAWWSGLARRERLLLQSGLALLCIALVWLLAVQPAWRTLSRAPAELDALDAQLQAMQLQASEVQQLRAAPLVTPDQVAAALKAASDRLGDKGKLVMQGERAVLTVNAIGTAALRDWLAEVRAGARARPLEANLQRSADGFSGTLVIAVGGAP
jgi:general secretion pathway protein M